MSGEWLKSSHMYFWASLSLSWQWLVRVVNHTQILTWVCQDSLQIRDWSVKSSPTHFWALPCISQQWLVRLKKGMRPSRKMTRFLKRNGSPCTSAGGTGRRLRLLRVSGLRNWVSFAISQSLWLTLTECSIAPRDERCEWILCELERCRIANRLTPGNAKSIKGKLSFLLQSLF